MSSKVSVEEAQAHLKELIDKLSPGEELLITEGQEPVAKLVCERAKPRQRPQPGFYKDKLIIVADDEDHLKDFTDYMP